MLMNGQSVVVHCAAGMVRCTMLVRPQLTALSGQHRTGVVCYLAQRHAGVSPEQALAGVLLTRPVTYTEVCATGIHHQFDGNTWTHCVER